MDYNDVGLICGATYLSTTTEPRRLRTRLLVLAGAEHVVLSLRVNTSPDEHACAGRSKTLHCASRMVWQEPGSSRTKIEVMP